MLIRSCTQWILRSRHLINDSEFARVLGGCIAVVCAAFPAVGEAATLVTRTVIEVQKTQHTTSTATKSAPYTRLITTSALALRSQHRNANLVQKNMNELVVT